MKHYFTNNEDLRSEIRVIDYNFSSFNFKFYSDLGVFSKNKVDYGSKILLESYLKVNNRKVNLLDVGCGYGYLGIVISKITDSECTLVDINKRAVHLAKRNIEENKVNANALVSDVYSEVKSKYDVIITNPPIRAGKDKVLEILLNAKDYLNTEGELWFVIRKDQGAKSIQKILENTYKVEIIEKSKGFYVFKAKTN